MTNEREPIRLPTYKPVLRAYERLVEAYLTNPTPAHLERVWQQELRLRQELVKPGRFQLGRMVQTIGAHNALAEAFHLPEEFILRHMHGDWGDLPAEDIQANEDALRHGARLLSAYRTRLDSKLWVITEWDRSATTLLLPEEY
ncbi:MAG: type I restriction endonuclease subunit M [Thermomicrobiales bacterium]